MECWALIQTTSCKQHPMVKEGSTWVYEAKPEAKYRYGRTTVEVVNNCFYEEITLEQLAQSDAVYSITGKLAAASGLSAAAANFSVF